MSITSRRPLGPCRTDLAEPPVRDPRAMTAAERAAAGDGTAEPVPRPPEGRGPGSSGSVVSVPARSTPPRTGREPVNRCGGVFPHLAAGVHGVSAIKRLRNTVPGLVRAAETACAGTLVLIVRLGTLR